MEALLSAERHPPPAPLHADLTWKPLGFLNLYRLALSSLLVLLYLGEHLPAPLGARDPELFFRTSLIYLALAIAAALAVQSRRPGFALQVSTGVAVDVALITVLMHASGGVTSGLGMLLIASIAGASMITAGRTALFYAALGSLALLAEQVYGSLIGVSIKGTSYQAGMLGFTFFVTAGLAYVLARRVRESEALARQRGLDLANMAQLTEYVIQRMQTGILVVDDDGQVRLINESAVAMLGLPGAPGPGARLAELSATLDAQLAASRRDPALSAPPFQPAAGLSQVQARFAPIGRAERDSGTLIFLEDTAAMAQYAQQLKLASLGRLTASIAHEVRNPLGAISHAGALLAESPALPESDRRLTRIIDEQARRVNGIIETILGLSRRDATRPERFALAPWLEDFLEDFSRTRSVPAAVFSRALQPGIELHMDPGHLRQILTNLVENALRHGAGNAATPTVELRSGLTAEFRRPYLEVTDRGPGIPAQSAQYIFEPFYTTRPAGTGLGLYIARELAECNQAQIGHLPAPGGGTTFRITFPDPRKKLD